MLRFQPNDPFPLLEMLGPSPQFKYSDSLRHSAAVDAWLGFRFAEIEASLAEAGCHANPSKSSGEKQQLWFGLDIQSLLTPYIEIRALLHRLQPPPGSTVVDLGAGYGRIGFVLARYFPETNFVGYEYVGERVREVERVLNLHPRIERKKFRMAHADLACLSFAPVSAQIYFIYDYGTPKAIEKTLHDLRRVAKRQPVTVVARGRNVRMLITNRHGWLVNSDSSGPEARLSVYTAGPSVGPEIIRQPVAKPPIGLQL